jgi:phage shock protein A
MLLGRLLRLLLEPAKDPLQDSLAASLERVSTLRARLARQVGELRGRAARLQDAALNEQLQRLEVEEARVRELEGRLTVEVAQFRARRDLLTARQTAAEANRRLAELVEALDAAQARALALADLSATISEEA